MFQPGIYITHKLLKKIVDLELLDTKLKNKYSNYSKQLERELVKDVLRLYEQKGSITHYPERSLDEFLTGNYEITEFFSIKNAYQAVSAFDQSLRAEDDWNLLVRINQLLNRDNLSIQITNLRSAREPADSRKFIKLHKFENETQLQHSALEILRWYRKSEGEINKFLRLSVVLYQLLKTSPFNKYNEETIFLCTQFFAKENSIQLIRMLPVISLLKKSKKNFEDLNDFISYFLSKLNSETKKLVFELDKKFSEETSPRKVLNLNQRQVEILKILQAKETISRNELAQMLEVSFMTAYRDLSGLVSKRLLKQKGNGRGTYYVLASR